MTNQTIEFLQQHAPDGNLSAQQAAQLLELAVQGDTGTLLPEQGSEPGATPASEQQPAGVQANESTPSGEPDPANTVVMAKDGVHTIDYSVLANEREGRKQERDEKLHWKAEASTKDQQLSAKDQEIEALRAQLQARQDAGGQGTAAENAAIAEQAIEQGIDPALFGDFTEEDIAKGVQTLVDQRVNAVVDARLKEVLAPYQQQQQLSAQEAHEKAIYTAHPDADSIAESKELSEWIASKPSFERRAYEDVLKQGTAAEIVDLFSAFKAGAGRNQPPAADIKAAAKAAIANTKPPVPASLSDIPGGTVGPASRDEAIAQMSGPDMIEAMVREGWSLERIENFMNQLV